jgi:hypothetical protein
VGQYIMSIKSQHVKNKHLFVNKGQNFVVNMLCVGGLVGEKKQKFSQYVAIFLLLKFRQLIIDVKRMKMSFNFFKVKNTPHKH